LGTFLAWEASLCRKFANVMVLVKVVVGVRCKEGLASWGVNVHNYRSGGEACVLEAVVRNRWKLP
jgi:hypothetical protein